MNKFNRSTSALTEFSASVLCLLLITFNVLADDTTIPTTPRNLSATSVSETQIDLEWDSANDNVGVSFYRIIRDNVEIGTSSVIAFSDSNLFPGVSYSYKIQAEDAAGNVSMFSRNATATTLDFTPPTAPQNIVAVPLSQTRIELSWGVAQDNVAVIGYMVYRDEMPLVTITSGENYIDSNLNAGTLYSYKISAIDAAGNESTPSSSVAAVTLDTSIPTIPGNLTGSALSETQVNLSWAASSDNVEVTEYIIFRDDIEIAASATPGYTDDNLQAGVAYNYYIRAADAAGNKSFPSTVVTIATLDTAAPTIPQNFIASALSETQVDLSWEASTDNGEVDHYLIYRDNVEIAKPRALTYRNSRLTAGTLYQYQITAIDNVGNESALSPVASVTTLDTKVPSTPTNLAATALSETQVNLTWAASSDNVEVTNYIIFRDDIEIALSATLGYTDESLQAGLNYEYYIRATDAAGNKSFPSTVVSITTLDTAAPTIPQNFVATAFSESQVDLSWEASTDNSGVDHYRIYRDNIEIAEPRELSYRDNRLTAGTLHQYQIIAIDNVGNESALSQVASVTTLDTKVPSTPANLTALSTLETQVDLFWSDSTDNVAVIGYKIYRDQVEISTATTAAYSDENLMSGNKYRYQVSAFDAAGNQSRLSKLVSVTPPDLTAPLPPENVSANPVSETQVDLAWDPSIDNVAVVRYFIFRDGINIADTSSTFYIDRNLAAGTVYNYRIEAGDETGNQSNPSEIVTATTLDTTPPDVPENLMATSTSETQVSLTWDTSNDNIGIKEYHIYRNNEQITSTVSNIFLDSELSADTSYNYRIQAEDTSGNLSFFSVTVVVTTPDLTPPTSPQNLTATPQSEVQIGLQWDPSTDNIKVADYHIYRDGILLSSISSRSGEKFTDRTLEVATSYTYMVIATDIAGNQSLPSTRVTAVTPDNTRPSAPQNRLAAAISETQVDLSWSPSSDNVGVSGYTIKRDDIEIATTQTTEYSDVGLSAGTIYTYGITAFDAAGNTSITGNVTTSTPDLTPPSIPENLIATVVSDVEIQLSWDLSTDNVGVTAYQVFREGQRIATTTEPFYADARLAIANTYTYTVIALDLVGNTSSESASVTETTLDSIPPTQPVNISLAGISSTEINMNWNPSSDNAGEVTYWVFRNDVFLTEIASTSFTDIGLSPYTGYTYEVSAVDESGNESARSSLLEVITLLSAVPTQIPQGVFYVLGDDANIPNIEDIENPAVTGFTIIAKWQNIEISEGVYDWSELEQKINAVTSKGKLVRLAITHGGVNTPQWIFNLGVETFTFDDEGEAITIPIFWDEIFLEKKVNFLNAIGQHFAYNTNVFAISAPCVNAKTGDWNFPASTELDVQNWLDKGYSSELLTQTCETIFDAATVASPNKFISVAVGGVSNDLEEDTLSVARHFVDYANNNYPGRLIPMSGSLSVNTPSPSGSESLHVWQLIYDNFPNSAGQLIWFVTDDETCRVNGGVTPCDPATTLLQVVDIVDDLDLAIVEIYEVDILNLELTDVINYAADILAERIVSVTSISDGSDVQSIVNIEAEVSNFGNVSHVEFFIDDNFLASVISSPYQFDWDSTTVENGKHVLTLKVLNDAGNTSKRTVKINVKN